MAVFYCKSGAGAAEFAQSTAYVSGDKIVPKISDAGTNFAVARKWVWECTTGGTSAGAEPTWPASVTQDVTPVTSNTAVFTARKPGFSSGTTANWSFSTIYLLYAVTCPTAAGDTIYVSNNHAETPAATYALSPVAGTTVLCVDDSATPPTTATTGASVSTTGTFDLTLNNSSVSGGYYEGITFICGVGSAATVTLQARATRLKNCSLQIASTGASSRITVSGWTESWENVSLKFGSSSQGLNPTVGMVWNAGSVIANSPNDPTALLLNNAGGNVWKNIDFSGMPSTFNLANTTVAGSLKVRNCKMPASWSGSVNSATQAWNSEFDLYNSSDSGLNYYLSRKGLYGTVTHELTIVRTGGASDGTTPISWKMVGASGAQYPVSWLVTPEIVVWNNTTGSAVTATIEIVSSATLKDDEIWLELEGYGTSGNPLGVIYTDKRAIMSASANQDTSTAAWASSPSTPVYQKLVVSFTPQLKGFIHAVVKLAKASTTVYVDPKITLS